MMMTLYVKLFLDEDQRRIEEIYEQLMQSISETTR